MEEREYYLGLDIGTSSVGWAVSNSEYKIIKKNGKALWGSRLFEEGNTAEKRRQKRSDRRRRDRQVFRKRLLREIFNEKISKVDPAFYLRLDESKFWEEDKKVEGKYCLFADKDWNDSDYHKKYPTIYHLRKELMENNEEHDIRLIFLAINHIIEHRGHFLYEGQDFDDVPEFETVWDEFCLCIDDILGVEIFCDKEQLKKILQQRLKIKEKERLLNGCFGNIKDNLINGIIKLLAGGKYDLSKLFGFSPEEKDKKSLSISLNDDDENCEKVYDVLKKYFDDGLSVVERLKALYNWGILRSLIGECHSFSEAQVGIYEEHKRDLKNLKDIIRKYKPEKYDEVFRKVGVKNYLAYSGHCPNDKKKNVKKASIDDFYGFIKSILNGIEEEDAKKILEKIELGTFLLKPRSKANSVIPYQLHLKELKDILDNASRYLPFLDEIDEQGYSTREKIESLVTFRVPYYVGPLDNNRAKPNTHWAVKHKDGERAFPWNYKEVVNLEASAEEFMNKLTNTCTYLTGETVLPRDSIAYSRFVLYNELNNVCYFGEKLSSECKCRAINDLFLTTVAVTKKKFISFLINNGYIPKGDEYAVTGIDENFKASLKTEIMFRDIFGEHMPSIDQMEKMILSIMLLNKEPQMLRNRIKEKVMPEITDGQLKKVCKIKCSGWGRLSKAFLYDIKAEIDGEELSILEALETKNYNLMQLLSSNYGYISKIEEYNCGDNNEHTLAYDAVERLNVSPSVRRSIWQTIKIVKEIRRIMKSDPKKIFIEMARGEDGSGKTVSRKNKLLEGYKAYKKLGEEIEEGLWDTVSNREETYFRRDALYLYFTQMGKCMYTGERIELEDLLNKKRFDKLYDIDHIWPQSKVKDDSLENRVLVKKTVNEEKDNVYPIKSDIRHKQYMFWKKLHDSGLIGNKKWERLIRSTPFTENELAGFISRQLVETRQGTKAIASMLKEAMSNTHIVYVKAGNVSDFRHTFDFVKVRDLNDMHHAKDAYLNIVVGNIFDVKFTSNPINFIKSKEKYSMKPKILYEKYDIKRNGNVAWTAGEDGSITAVRSMMRKNNIMVTRQEVRRNSGQNGGLFDCNPTSTGSIPLKGSDKRLWNTERYGGYNGDTGAYMIFVEHTAGKKKVRSFQPIYLRYVEYVEESKDNLLWYCTEVLGLKEPRIILKEVKYNTEITIKGFSMSITGRTGNRITGNQSVQLILSPEEEKRMKSVIKVAERKKREKERFILNEKYDNVSNQDNIGLYDSFVKKMEKSVYKNRPAQQLEFLNSNREKFVELSVAEQCEALVQILQLFRNGGKADLSILGGGKNVGTIKTSGQLSKNDRVIMTQSSVTGFYSREIDLMKI